MITASPYLVLMLLATPIGASFRTMIGFWTLGAAAWLMIGKTEDGKEEKDGHMAAWIWTLPILLIAGSRIAPIVRWGWQGLGADSAAYRLNFGKCLETLSACRESPASLAAYPLRALGAAPDAQTAIVAIALQALLVIAIYAAAKERFGRKAAFWSVTVYALSISQFVAYWSLFLNMELAIGLSLLTMVAYSRRSRGAWVWAAAAGICHFVAFIPLGIALVAMTVAGKGSRRYAGMALALSCGTVLAYQAPYIGGYAKHAAAYALGAPDGGQGLFLAGHFVSLAAYHGTLMPFYLPFGLVALAWTLRKKEPDILAAYAASALGLMVTRGIFHNRFIILFDIACIVFAGKGIERLWDALPKTGTNKAIAGMIFVLLASNALYESARMEPLMDRTEFAEIRGLEGKFAGVPIFVNDAAYRQFVEGYSGHPAIAADFSREPWQLLGKPSLIYNARRSTPFEPDLDPRAERISNRFWKYE